MGKRRKPTQKEVVQVINSLIQEIHTVKNDIRTLCGTLDMYIEFKDDQDGFSGFINERIKKEADNDVSGNAKSSPAPVEASP